MIQFFELLNDCSPSRTISYLIFILIFTFIVFGGISDIIYAIKGITKANKEGGEAETNEDITNE